jgi:hypothetical protein
MDVVPPVVFSGFVACSLHCGMQDELQLPRGKAMKAIRRSKKNMKNTVPTWIMINIRKGKVINVDRLISPDISAHFGK